MINKVISGGQTGADRGGLDAAIELGIMHGGICPKGRKAEDGVIPEQYVMAESNSPNYKNRTKDNVHQSDATLIFIGGATITGGSKLTASVCTQNDKPYMVISVHCDGVKNNKAIVAFLKAHQPSVLNVAGNRESKSPGLQAKVKDILVNALRYATMNEDEE